jgi:hypothetical protein
MLVCGYRFCGVETEQIKLPWAEGHFTSTSIVAVPVATAGVASLLPHATKHFSKRLTVV